MAVYFYYGEEDYNLDLEIEKMRLKLNPDFQSMNFQAYDSPEYSKLINILRTPPMMFGKMLIVINAYKYFFKIENKEIKFEDSELADIEDALKNISDSLDIVFILKLPRGENKKLDSRKKIFKILSSFNTKEFNTFKSFETDKIASWIKDKVKQKELSITEDAVELLIEQIGNNLRQFDIELDKLKLIAYPQTNITKKMVEEICISNQDVFNITKSLMLGEKDKALLEFKKLLDFRYPLEIISVIQTMLRQWIIVKTVSSNSKITEITGLKDGRIYHLQKDLKNISIDDLIKLKENLFDVEYRIKAGEVLDINSEVENALIR